MNTLVRETCLNHLGREAVARCPECGQFYCRECITEHEDRVICASCLRKILFLQRADKSVADRILQGALCFAGVLTAWLFFYGIAHLLLKVPTQFHDGSLWKMSSWSE